ncbi:MAG: RT0821/Lpp0805 family surface protein [Alphaproteobacteria bacterium]|nr:RT0821/Lpp0805 family surface protein [Alphaproteobacteria bacterium]
MQRRLIVAIVAISCAMGAFPPKTYAQLDIFGAFANNLTPEDITMMKNTSAQLYLDDRVSLSSTMRWTNPKSGNSGAVTLLQRYEYKGMKCRTIRHSVKEKRRDRSSALNFDRCKTPSGEWMLR